MPYVDAVVAVTVMCVLAFVLDVSILREGDGAWMIAILVWWKARHEYVGGTRGSGIVSSTIDECDAFDESRWRVKNVYVFGSVRCRR